MATPFIDDIFRAASSATVAIDLLGLLYNLPGHWTGKGFNTKNANVAQMDAIFWIEKVTNPTKKPTNLEYMQL